jgi:hypothetical protein
MSSFIVRLVRGGLPKLQGRVRHVRTGEERSFANGEELLAFMEELNPPEPDQPAPSRPRKAAVSRSRGRARS